MKSSWNCFCHFFFWGEGVKGHARGRAVRPCEARPRTAAARRALARALVQSEARPLPACTANPRSAPCKWQVEGSGARGCPLPAIGEWTQFERAVGRGGQRPASRGAIYVGSASCPPQAGLDHDASWGLAGRVTGTTAASRGARTCACEGDCKARSAPGKCSTASRRYGRQQARCAKGRARAGGLQASKQTRPNSAAPQRCASQAVVL